QSPSQLGVAGFDNHFYRNYWQHITYFASSGDYGFGVGYPAQIHGSSPRAELRLTATPREITSARVAGLVPVVATAPSKLGRTRRAASITGWVRGPITNTNCLEAIRTRQRRAQLRTFLLTRTLLAVPGFTTATDTMKLDQDRGTRSVQIPRLSFPSYGFLKGIAVRPLPCNYNILQFVCALSRR